MVDGEGVPLAAHLDSASPNEVTLIETMLGNVAVPGQSAEKNHHLVYDRASDSDPLRDRIAKRGIEMICPHRGNRVKPPRQNLRKLRRYRRRR